MIAYVTIIGKIEQAGMIDLRVGDTVRLVKEPTNCADNEAILVQKSDDSVVGYVCNSVKTVVQGTYSAGRLYDKFDNCIAANIVFLKQGVLAIAEVEIE
jgi:hypothetical protein